MKKLAENGERHFEFDRLNECLCRVFEDDQLVGDDAIENLLLLVSVINPVDAIYVLGFMKLSLAATVSFCTVKNLVNIDLVCAARVLISRSKWPMKVHLHLGWLLMVSAVAHFCNRIVLVASIAFDKV